MRCCTAKNWSTPTSATLTNAMTDRLPNDDRRSANTRFSVGLTGGIGSGKSTVADLFALRGAAIIDTDVIAHRLTGPSGKAIPAIRAAFGTEVLAAENALDRSAMRARIFSDPPARKKLESILHPMIRKECEREARLASGPYLMFVVPLLVESGTWRDRVSRILVVDCDEEEQVRRVMQRNNLPREQVLAILAAQASRQERLAVADDLIVNHLDLQSLHPEIDRLHAFYITLARAA